MEEFKTFEEVQSELCSPEEIEMISVKANIIEKVMEERGYDDEEYIQKVLDVIFEDC